MAQYTCKNFKMLNGDIYCGKGSVWLKEGNTVSADQLIDFSQLDQFTCHGGVINARKILLPAAENCDMQNCQLNGEVAYNDSEL